VGTRQGQVHVSLKQTLLVGLTVDIMRKQAQSSSITCPRSWEAEPSSPAIKLLPNKHYPTYPIVLICKTDGQQGLQPGGPKYFQGKWLKIQIPELSPENLMWDLRICSFYTFSNFFKTQYIVRNTFYIATQYSHLAYMPEQDLQILSTPTLCNVCYFLFYSISFKVITGLGI
jgi:hypothetical protein